MRLNGAIIRDGRSWSSTTLSEDEVKAILAEALGYDPSGASFDGLLIPSCGVTVSGSSPELESGAPRGPGR